MNDDSMMADRPIRRTEGYDPPIIIEKILAVIEACKLSHRAVCSKAGLTPQRIARWVTQGGVPSAYETLSLAKVLDMDYVYLLMDDIPLVSPAPPFRDLTRMRTPEEYRAELTPSGGQDTPGDTGPAQSSALTHDLTDIRQVVSTLANFADTLDELLPEALRVKTTVRRLLDRS